MEGKKQINFAEGKGYGREKAEKSCLGKGIWKGKSREILLRERDMEGKKQGYFAERRGHTEIWQRQF